MRSIADSRHNVTTCVCGKLSSRQTAQTPICRLGFSENWQPFEGVEPIFPLFGRVTLASGLGFARVPYVGAGITPSPAAPGAGRLAPTGGHYVAHSITSTGVTTAEG